MHRGRVFTLAVEDHIKPKRGVFFILLQVGVRVAGVPRENFWKTDANGAILAQFFLACWFFSKKFCVIFAFKAPIFDIRDVGEFSPELRGSYKVKRGVIYPLAVGGGGDGVSPRTFLTNECKWCILSPFYRLPVHFFLPKLCVIFAFKVPISDILVRDTGEVFSFLTGGGGSSPGFFFLKNGYKSCIQSIHSRLVVGIFFLISLLSWKPRCAEYVMREFPPHLQGII